MKPTVMARLRARRTDDGFTLVELLVAMMLFGLLMALVATATTAMYKVMRKQTGQTDSQDTVRKVIELFDHQVRYANAFKAPATGTDGGTYVAWRTGNAGQQQTCYQWRLGTDGRMQYRTWKPPLTGGGAVTASAWATEATNIAADGSNPVFSLTSQVGSTASPTRQQLTVDFQATRGKPATTTRTSVTLTALNSTTSGSGAASVCDEVGMP